MRKYFPCDSSFFTIAAYAENAAYVLSNVGHVNTLNYWFSILVCLNRIYPDIG